MKTLKTILSVGAVAMSLTALTAVSAQAGDQPNIMIMGEDSDTDTVPRDSRVFKRVMNALSDELDREGFDVYDETAITLDDFEQGRTRRTDSEIIDIARSVKRPPIDVATIFSIYASAKKNSYTTKVKARIEGRMLNVRTGKRLGNFEVELPMAGNAPKKCDRECLLEIVGGMSKELARDLGAVLAMKLDALSPAGKGNGNGLNDDDEGGMDTAYSIKFIGFDSKEITSIEEYITAFSGYQHHRPVSSSMRTSEYWYETGSDEARLNRNLRKMLDHLGVEGRVVHSGSSFTIDKISTDRKRR